LTGKGGQHIILATADLTDGISPKMRQHWMRIESKLFGWL
jgi:hypothetical protein